MVTKQSQGDVLVVQFDQEEEVAIFVPASADVLYCSSKAWKILSQTVLADQLQNLLADQPGAEPLVDPDGLALRASLDRNSVCLLAL